jgi:hypothetical protein
MVQVHAAVLRQDSKAASELHTQQQQQLQAPHREDFETSDWEKGGGPIASKQGMLLNAKMQKKIGSVRTVWHLLSGSVGVVASAF